MNVKEAVKKAIVYVADIFESERPENIGLEEVVLNEGDNMWEVTVGFSRPWDHQRPNLLVATLQSRNPQRQYKVVRIDNESGEIKSIKIRGIKNA